MGSILGGVLKEEFRSLPVDDVPPIIAFGLGGNGGGTEEQEPSEGDVEVELLLTRLITVA